MAYQKSQKGVEYGISKISKRCEHSKETRINVRELTSFVQNKPAEQSIVRRAVCRECVYFAYFA